MGFFLHILKKEKYNKPYINRIILVRNYFTIHFICSKINFEKEVLRAWVTKYYQKKSFVQISMKLL